MIEKLSIITLDTDKKYVVVETMSYNDHNYLFLARIDDNEEILEEKIIVEQVKTDKGYGVKPIEDKEIMKSICQKYLDNI